MSSDVSNERPKKVLTEAQRLAFLKGREKRMANIERKRQEKLEAQQGGVEPEPTPKPTKKRVKKEKPEPVSQPERVVEPTPPPPPVVEVKEEPVDDKAPPSPKTDNEMESDSDEEEIMQGEDDDYHQVAAKQIAGYLFEHLQKLKPSSPPPPPPQEAVAYPKDEDRPKRKYERKAVKPEPTATPVHPPVPAHRSINWM